MAWIKKEYNNTDLWTRKWKETEMAEVALKNVWKRYTKETAAVQGFSLDIADREFVVLVGPSGCGKSTTLRMIAGLEEITEGELSIDGRVVNGVAPKDRDIAMVFQNYALYPHMSVYENIAFGLKMRKTPKDEIDARVMEAASILGIESLLQRKPKALSGGQRQRVALGRAMVRNPAVFLLDEPLSNLDAKLRTSMRTELIKLHKKLQTTFIYVTHDQTEAMTMGDRLVVMKDGIIQQVDTPQNLYDHPCNIFVAGFIGSPQMNFIHGILGADEAGYHVDVSGDRLCIADTGPGSDGLKGYIGKNVALGIRPEDFRLAHDAGGGASDFGNPVINAKIDVRELMGSECYLYLRYKDRQLIARIPTAEANAASDWPTFCVDKEKIYLFDAETEQAIGTRKGCI
ncbi:MAG: sn-glycerol-3-phosphate ABC transporter ATP-binding protein UgpC [Clostridiales Family XIII bacterium]|nr:sn-glycerol-3-phosphate ABC transporter ATP-binding protein UgpC [Clostridiales Family XIII bacterium]